MVAQTSVSTCMWVHTEGSLHYLYICISMITATCRVYRDTKN